MNVAVIGSGYVGLVAGACFSETGHVVTCVDIDERKIEGLKRNVLPIYEPGLGELVERNQANRRLAFTTDIASAVAAADVVFIAVGTPPEEDGAADLRHVLAVARTIGQHVTREMVVVNKSTVPVGTAPKVRAAVEEQAQFPVHVVSNPEFLKEGSAVDDFMRPDRVVLGVESEFARAVMTDLYEPFVRTGRPIFYMDVASAEMTKYAANGMLATRITFMNEIATLCDAAGANVDDVRRGVGADTRIGPSFLFPGPGYGGSCFPKDVKALVRSADEYDVPLSVLHAVDSANERQKRVLGIKLREALGASLAGAHVAVWGLSFKPNTDDMREAPSLVLIEEILRDGGTVCAHDPVAMDEARRRLGDQVRFAPTSYDALSNADALVIVTDWTEYRHPEFARMRQLLKRPIVIDGRNLYDPAKVAHAGLTYYSIGRPMAGVQEVVA